MDTLRILNVGERVLIQAEMLHDLAPVIAHYTPLGYVVTSTKRIEVGDCVVLMERRNDQ